MSKKMIYAKYVFTVHYDNTLSSCGWVKFKVKGKVKGMFKVCNDLRSYRISIKWVALDLKMSSFKSIPMEL